MESTRFQANLFQNNSFDNRMLSVSLIFLALLFTLSLFFDTFYFFLLTQQFLPFSPLISRMNKSKNVLTNFSLTSFFEKKADFDRYFA